MKQAILISTGLLLAAPSIHAEKNKDKKPNVVFILADDLGYGDLSCYGQEKFETPNIDKLAQSGMRFTQCYSGTTVSAPSRSCLLTARTAGIHLSAVTSNSIRKDSFHFPQMPVPSSRL